MTSKAAFSPVEWKVVLEGPPSAGMIVVTAARGGMIRESIAMSKATLKRAPSTARANSSTRSSRRSPRWTTRGITLRQNSGITG